MSLCPTWMVPLSNKPASVNCLISSCSNKGNDVILVFTNQGMGNCLRSLLLQG